MAQEVHISINDSGMLTSEHRGGETLAKDPSTTIYIFEKPLALQKFIESSSETASSLGSNTVSFPEVHKIRLSILNSLSESELTELEANGGVDGPNLSPLIQGWRDAIRPIPKGHHIQELQFNMACGQQIALREIVRLLQHISTVLNIKSHDSVRCSVVGCEDDRRIWLEQSVVGSGSTT